MPTLSASARPGPVPSIGLWHRTLRLLAQVRRPRPAAACLPRTSQVRALMAVLDDAVAAQKPVDAAVAACGAPEGPTGQAAQDCGRAGSRIHQLCARLRELPLTQPDLVEVRALAGRLLSYDQWMVRQALNLAFSAHPDARTEAARLQFNGLCRPADDLRRLRDALEAISPEATWH
ncbi:hypothetical protein [Streptomyces sp. T028]|uniref:hypothetical protein n=1 Tax=Streptomyces sp. T028 TaxID=3394379 RepID=UPI003A8C4EA8